MTIIIILAGMMLPALQQARDKAKQTRWLGVKRDIQLHPYCIAYWTFEQDTIEGNRVLNLSEAASKVYSHRKYNPRDLDGTFGGGDGDKYPIFLIGGGRFGKGSLQYDGDDDYIDCGQDSVLDFKGALSIEAWVKWFPYTNPGGDNIAGCGNNCLNGYYGYSISIKDNKVKFKLTDYGNENNVEAVSSGTYNDNEWHHVVGIADRSQALMKVYVDGVAGSNADPSQIKDFRIPTVLFIGKMNYVSHEFTGLIDEVAIYNQVLTTQEIQSHYRGGRP